MAAPAVQSRPDPAPGESGPPSPVPPAPRGTGLGGIFGNAKIRSKVALILVVPVLAIFVLAGLRVTESARDAASAGETQQLARLGVEVSALVHDLQRERARARDYVRDNTQLERFAEQRARTDVSARRFGEASAALPGELPAVIESRVKTTRARVDALRELRLDVTFARDTLSGATYRYGIVIGDLLGLFESLNRASDDQALIQQVRTAAAFAGVKEYVAQEETQLLGVLATGTFDSTQFRAFNTALANQQALYNQFEATATSEQLDAAQAVTGDAGAGATELEERALRSFGKSTLGFTVAEWTAAITTKLDRMRQVEQQLAETVVARAGDLRGDAVRRSVVDSALVLLALLLALAMSLLVAQSMIRPLLRLRSTAHEVAYRSLPAAVQRLREQDPRVTGRGGALALTGADLLPRPTTVQSRDEIGDVGRAFDEVHREAVRVASEQATLRQNVSTMFVNLSRRSQLLVDRLIRQIDSLEQGENDPDRLSELFVLDHLATRMRRNDENLLVLAGAEVSRRWSEPAPLVDVLRAASAEVEQYARVEFGLISGDARVLGSAVNDVVHLAAELLENATTYSSPRTSVIVDARRVDDRVLIEIEDRGIGMSPEQFTELNRRLAESRDVDVTVSRMMGLFVVSRLAARHGISVQLRPSAGGGVLALITLPPAVLTATADDGRGAHRVGDVRGGDGAAMPEEATAPRLTDAAATATYQREVGPGPTRRPLPAGAEPARLALPPAGGPPAQVNGTPVGAGRATAGATPPVPVPAPVPARGLNGHAAAALLPAGPGPAALVGATAEDTVTLAIFEAVESEWFRAHPAGERVTADRPAPVATQAGETVRPIRAVPAAEPAAAEAPAEQPAGTPAWQSPADQGWVAASSAASPVADGKTRTGLPRRVPMAQLVPGGVESRPAARTPAKPGAAPPSRSADAIRGTLSSYTRGSQQGRRAGRSGQQTPTQGSDGGRPGGDRVERPGRSSSTPSPAPARRADGGPPETGPGVTERRSGARPGPGRDAPNGGGPAAAGAAGANAAGPRAVGPPGAGPNAVRPPGAGPNGAGPAGAAPTGAGPGVGGRPAGTGRGPAANGGSGGPDRDGAEPDGVPPARSRLPQRTPGTHQPEALRDSRPGQDARPTRGPAPDGQAPDGPAPHGRAPHDPAPHDPAPHDPAPHDPAPHDPAPHRQEEQ